MSKKPVRFKRDLLRENLPLHRRRRRRCYRRAHSNWPLVDLVVVQREYRKHAKAHDTCRPSKVHFTCCPVKKN